LGVPLLKKGFKVNAVGVRHLDAEDLEEDVAVEVDLALSRGANEPMLLLRQQTVN
jgi:hypothetical protein